MQGRAYNRRRRAQFEAEALPHLPALYNFACALAGATDAEDLVQMTCVRALEQIDSYQLGTNVRAWLFTILRNQWVSRLRQVRRVEMSTIEEIAVEPWDESADLEELLAERRWSAEIRAALLALPPAYRLPVYLKDIEGFGYREIAEIVGCPLGTVMSRLARGRAALRAALVGQARERGLLSATGVVDGSHGV